MNPKFHIFISYRREDGKDIARMLKESLEHKGYRVFLDLDELQEGVFDEQILEAIDAAPIYMVVMTKKCFERCHNPKDWVRLELEHALAKGKTIIPINPDKQFVSFPDTMPEHLKQAISALQYSMIDTEFLYKESVDKLVRERVKPITGFRYNALVWAIVLFFVTLVPYAGAYYYSLPDYYLRKGDKLLAQDSVTPTQVQEAIKYYKYAIDARNIAAYGRIADIYNKTTIFDSNWVTNGDSALYYYKQGAYLGDGYSQCKLASLLSSNYSVENDLDSAFYWASVAYEAGYYKAPVALAYFYRNGLYVAKDIHKAESLYKEGVAKGDSAAHAGLGTLLLFRKDTSRRGEAVENLINGYLWGDKMMAFVLGIGSKWVVSPKMDSATEPLVSIKAIGWDEDDTMTVYCEWHNKQYQWMQIDSSAYVEDALTGKRYTVDTVGNCKFLPDTTQVPMGRKHEFQLVFANVPSTLTRINICESDSSQWKFYGVDVSEKIEVTY